MEVLGRGTPPSEDGIAGWRVLPGLEGFRGRGVFQSEKTTGEKRNWESQEPSQERSERVSQEKPDKNANRWHSICGAL